MTCEHMFVHHASLRHLALDLVARRNNDCEIARPARGAVGPRCATGASRAKRHGRAADARARAAGGPRRRVAFSDADYAELLGLYLGDGHITAMARTEQLRISLDAKYPTVNDEIDALLRRCFPDNRVGRVLFDGGSTVVLHVYSRHLACLFPQAGPGKKHERAIALEPWQAGTWRRAVGLPARLHPLGRLRVREPDRAVRVPVVRLLQPAPPRSASSSSTRARLGLACRPAGNRVRINRRRERRAAARARRPQVLSPCSTLILASQAAVVKLVYTQASGACGLTPVEVRVLSAAYRRRRC